MNAPLRPPTPINLDQLEARILGRLAGMHWYTLIIDAGAWRRVAERAGEMGYVTYCPMSRMAAQSVTNSRSHTRRSSVVERPLMPGYLFVDMPGPKRFDLFTPSNDPGDRPEELPEGDLRGYVAHCVRTVVEPVYGCRGLLDIDGSPVALHEAVIEDIRLRERNGEFDLTELTEDGRHRVAKWIKRAITEKLSIQCVDGPFASFFGFVVKIKKPTLITVEVNLFGRGSVIDMPVEWVRLA